jgi:antitoxin component of MazEF toxin-antitoxin module
MPRRKLENKNIRKLTRMGLAGSSLGLTIPKEIATELGWRERQKVVVKKSGKKLIIEDWPTSRVKKVNK